jgi:proteasome lid subunit RPN8/RPN11
MRVSSERVRRLVLSEDAAECIREEIAKANYREICGFLMGYRAATDVHVRCVRPAENIYQDKNSFAISQQNYVAALRTAGQKESVVGIYHVHYGSPYPSCHDVGNMALHSFLWLIVGVSARPEHLIQRWKCFQLAKGKIREVGIEHLRLSLL